MERVVRVGMGRSRNNKAFYKLTRKKYITCWKKYTDMQTISVSEKQKPRWSIKIMKSFHFLLLTGLMPIKAKTRYNFDLFRLRKREKSDKHKCCPEGGTVVALLVGTSTGTVTLESKNQ